MAVHFIGLLSVKGAVLTHITLRQAGRCALLLALAGVRAYHGRYRPVHEAWASTLSGAGGRLSQQITQLLHRWQQGDLDAREHLFEALYSDLMQIARHRLSNHTNGTLQPAALVNESLMRLLGSTADYNDRTHFIAIAALKMRSVLVDHLRARSADKRGGNAEQLTLSHAVEMQDDSAIGYDVLALHQALNQLAEMEPRAASTIELTYFGGMSREEIALVLGVSAPTVDRDLRFARAWLNRQLR